ncbi:MAG TPA: hypothetical protein VFR76_09540, partial [Verrucomicrobiae bacterium]|nr:hypothetical protein [Verrucomicrobiae bacterium]
MKLARRCLVLVLLFALAQFAPAAQAQARRKSEASKPKPDLADFKYGPHERNVLDLWKAKSDEPTPLVELREKAEGENGRAEDRVRAETSE